MHLWRGGLDGDGLGRAAGRRRFGLGLLLHGVVVRHAAVGHLGLTLKHHTQIQTSPFTPTLSHPQNAPRFD